MATRPLDPIATPEAAALAADPAADLLRPAPLTHAAVALLVAERLAAEPDPAFARSCLEVTGGNPFLLGELLDEAAARGFVPTAAAAPQVGSLARAAWRMPFCCDWLGSRRPPPNSLAR